MKRCPNFVLSLFTLLLSGISCRKNTLPSDPVITRKIQYVLYTNKDFSDNNRIITFSLTMRKGMKLFLDSSLAPMRIAEIPNAANKIIIEKNVPANVNSDLLVGFIYSIENVGYSWCLDTLKAGEISKTIDFAFE